MPLLSPSFVPSEKNIVLTKVASDFDFYLPFRRHVPSLANAQRVIYADVDRLTSDDGVGLFNILAFRGVFFGSPFACSNHFRWFNSLADWKNFYNGQQEEAKKYDGEEYYVNKNCYGQAQIGRQLSLLDLYWDQRLLWNNKFNKFPKPTAGEVFAWLISRHPSVNKSTNKNKHSATLFHNIGCLTALLICGDLVEACVIPFPTAKEWAELIAKAKKGARAGMEMCGLIVKESGKEEVCEAFALLDRALQHELRDEEKAAMGYNIIMLEHTLCKIK